MKILKIKEEGNCIILEFDEKISEGRSQYLTMDSRMYRHMYDGEEGKIIGREVKIVLDKKHKKTPMGKSECYQPYHIVFLDKVK